MEPKFQAITDFENHISNAASQINRAKNVAVYAQNSGLMSADDLRALITEAERLMDLVGDYQTKFEAVMDKGYISVQQKSVIRQLVSECDGDKENFWASIGMMKTTRHLEVETVEQFLRDSKIGQAYI